MNDIDELLTRGVANIIPGKEELKKVLESGKKLNVYLGIDPTATKIHLGHTVPLRTLNRLANLGHNVTFLIGDFTALIGDTSDKESERPVLTSSEIENNFKDYKRQAEKVLDFSKVQIKYNSHWLKQLNFEEIVKLCHHFSGNDFISRELVKKRLSEGKGIGLHEFLYPVMQGYDSYFMDTDIQVGGTDQTFNMQAGRTLQKDLRHKESFVMAITLLVGSDGKKMSKTQGNVIWLDDNPDDMYAKIMSISDNLVIDYFLLATNTSIDEIEEFKKRCKSEPMIIKKILADRMVEELHGPKPSEEARLTFEVIVQKKGVPTDIREFSLEDNGTITDVLTKAEFAESNSEAKRLIEQGGVTLNDKKITNSDAKIEEGILRVGKKRFIKIVIK